MITDPVYLSEGEAESLCTEASCVVHGNGTTQCPVLVAEALTVEHIRDTI